MLRASSGGLVETNAPEGNDLAMTRDIAAAQLAPGPTAGRPQATVIDEVARIRELVRRARWELRRADEPSALNVPPQPHRELADTAECGLPVSYVVGALQAPLNGEVGRLVRALLDRGERAIILDLSRTSTVDAAGVGELVRAYNMAVAAGCALRIVRPSPRVHQILERVGLLDILRRG
jgi:anti-anti-sigma factor